jgi:hypothetical protein
VIGTSRPHIKQHVRGFDIAVHQPGGVRCVQCRGHTGEDGERVRGRERAAAQHQRMDVAGRDVAHRDEQGPVSLAGLVHRDDVRVVDSRRGLRLEHEALTECRVRRRLR